MTILSSFMAAMALGSAPLLSSAFEQKEVLLLAAQGAKGRAEVADVGIKQVVEIGYQYRGRVPCVGAACLPVLSAGEGGRYIEQFGYNPNEEATYTLELPVKVRLELATSGPSVELNGVTYSTAMDDEIQIGQRGDRSTTTLKWMSGTGSAAPGSGEFFRATFNSIGCPQPRPTCEGDCDNITIYCGTQACNCGGWSGCGCENSWAVERLVTGDQEPAGEADIKFQGPASVYLDIVTDTDYLLLGGKRYPESSQMRYQAHLGSQPSAQHGMLWKSDGGAFTGWFLAVIGPYNKPVPWWELHFGAILITSLVLCSCFCGYQLYFGRSAMQAPKRPSLSEVEVA